MVRMNLANREQVRRLERAGFAVHRTAQDLREVRERFPARDELALRLQALEEEARTLAGMVAMELRELEVYGGGRAA
jgi:hypothetical protein